MSSTFYHREGPSRPLPFPVTAPGGPLLGPGARVTGALGLGAASDTSFCRLTPFAAAPGFTLGDLFPLSFATSEMAGGAVRDNKWLMCVWVCVYQVMVAFLLQ